MPQSHTAWTRKGSSVPSDRIKPVQSQSIPVVRGKGKQQPPEPPKSKEVRRLTSLLQAIQESSGTCKDPKGGCFCQAREHTISTYSPLCTACGLILCSINLPQYSCPHCNTPIVAAAARDLLVARLESQLSETIALEIQKKEQDLAEARKAAGAFPTLASTTENSPSSSPNVTSTNQTHKVLSVNSKTKKVTVSSYNPTPVSSRPVSRAESEEEPLRVPPPPSEVTYSARRVSRTRPWENLGDPDVKYVSPLPRVGDEGGSKEPGKRNRYNEGKGNKANSSASSIPGRTRT